MISKILKLFAHSSAFMPGLFGSDSAVLFCLVLLGEELCFESILHLSHMGSKAAETALSFLKKKNKFLLSQFHNNRFKGQALSKIVDKW